MNDKLSEQERKKQAREERLAKNLRDNLRRRKAATRRSVDKTVTGAPESP